MADIQPHGSIARLTVTHENLADERDRADAAPGWAAVLSHLKSLLGTGSPLPGALVGAERLRPLPDARRPVRATRTGLSVRPVSVTS
ncbi:hypothetical protein AB0M97_12125 [Streptomyces sp. NPDC051207]|uniref:hypothetical protein n=1 Tax=Streptomyces sp. NPDC051207 TaxID=3154641 RepID=UPI00342A23EE